VDPSDLEQDFLMNPDSPIPVKSRIQSGSGSFTAYYPLAQIERGSRCGKWRSTTASTSSASRERAPTLARRPWRTSSSSMRYYLTTYSSHYLFVAISIPAIFNVVDFANLSMADPVSVSERCGSASGWSIKKKKLCKKRIN
jgi:hypothetical protein